MKLMSSKENLLILITFNNLELIFNSIVPKVRIKRILGATKDRWIGAKEFSKLNDLRLFPRTLVAVVAHVANLID